MKILLIEDEKKLADSISAFLIRDGYIVETVNDFEQGIIRAAINEYDCLLIDIMLPDGSGLDIVKELKKIKSNAGILIISAKDSLDDKIIGLDLGADDYVTKPFHLAELNARIKSVLRRKKFGGLDQVEYQEITINTRSGEVRVHEKMVDLTKKEYQLLLFFLSNPDRMVTKEAIAEHLWGDYIIDVDSFDFIYVHIKNLRKKMRGAGGRDYIKTVYGLGYKFTDH